MANAEHLALLKHCIEKRDFAEWNSWREDVARARADEMTVGSHEAYRTVDLQGADLSRCTLKGANLAGANLRGANLEGAILEGVDLQEAELLQADLQGGMLSGANLRGADMRHSNLRMANLVLAGLQGANLRGAEMQQASLQGASLQGADLWNAKLERAGLEQVNLEQANLEQADLREASLPDANLRRARLRGAELRWADLREADLEGADVRETILETRSSSQADAEAELAKMNELVGELRQQLARLQDDGEGQKRERNETEERLAEAERNELKERLAEAEQGQKDLNDELAKMKKDREVTAGRIDQALENLQRPNKYITWESGMQRGLFWLFLVLAASSIVYLVCSFANNPVTNADTQDVVALIVNDIVPRVVALSLFAVFLTQANRRRRTLQDLNERKRGIETLRGVFMTINTLSDSPQVALKRIDSILDKLAEQALTLAQVNVNKPTPADHDSDRVEVLKEIRELLVQIQRKPS